jgi:hypothetical protein
MKQSYSPLAWVALLFLIGLAMITSGRVSPENLPIRPYNVRDYVRGNHLITIRIPYTTESDGLIGVTSDHQLIRSDSDSLRKLADADFALFMAFRDQQCPKPSDIPTATVTTPNYVVGVQCSQGARQYEFAPDALPDEMHLLLRLANQAP